MQTFTFWQLATKYKIEIPIIQRDYAQGRCDTKSKEIRDKFLDDLLNSLKKNESLQLDFIYGKVEDDTFIPIDGQQRLTTIFLLHWYIAKRNNKQNLDIKGFSYKTRISAKDFCKCLIKGNLQIDFKNDKFSDNIENASWFFLLWQKDPTVQSMLNMLDSIHDKFKHEENDTLNVIWETLITLDYSLPEDNPRLNDLIATIESSNDNKCINALNIARAKPNISFEFLNLEDFKLTDELYLKMNARGKALTDFENFKAQFEKHIIDKRWEVEIQLIETFSYKIDTIWTDLFWKYRNVNNQIDGALIKFIAEIAINRYAQNHDIDGLETIQNRIKELVGNPNKINYKDFNNEKDFQFLVKCLNIYSCNNNYDTLFPQDLKMWDFFLDDTSTLFKEILKEKVTYNQRVLFYAQTIYLFKDEKFEELKFADWMRVIRNIVQNFDINNANLSSAINLINELSCGCRNIYSNFSSTLIISNFASNQVKEEKIKSCLINNNHAWKAEIIEAENHPLFTGNIEFLLTEQERPDLDQFIKRKNIAIKLFNKDGDNLGKNSYLLLRSVLAKCDDDIIIPLQLIDSRKNWKELLKKDFIKKGIVNVLDDLIIGNDFSQVLNDTCNNYSEENWQSKLVRNAILLIDYSVERRIANQKDWLFDENILCLCYLKYINDEDVSIKSNKRLLFIQDLLNKYRFILNDEVNKTTPTNPILFKLWEMKFNKSFMNNNLVITLKRYTLKAYDGITEKDYVLTDISFIDKLSNDYPFFFIEN